MNRRNVLKLVGGGVVLAAAVGGSNVVVMNRWSDAARMPWREAGRYNDRRKRFLSYALLAPNPHNRQPWLVRLDGTDMFTLYVDLARRLPATDPFDRQITIGCGAFLEILTIAASQEGYSAEIAPFPEGEDQTSLDRRPIAMVRLIRSGIAPNPLFAQILKRRSNKQVYSPRDVPATALAAIAEASHAEGLSSFVTGNTEIADKLRDLTWRAHFREVMTPTAMQESVDLMRIGAREVAANPDGIALDGIGAELGGLAGMVTRQALGNPSSTAFRKGLDYYRDIAMSARAFGWITNTNQSRADQLNAGRAYVRMNLTATELGLSVHPWSQALQEYEEMADIFQEIHDLIGQEERIQMLYRIGYASETEPAPRRGLEAHLV